MRRATTVVAKTSGRKPHSLLLDGGEVPLQLGELGPLLGVVLPAALHHLVHVLWAALRARHPVTWRRGGFISFSSFGKPGAKTSIFIGIKLFSSFCTFLYLLPGLLIGHPRVRTHP